MRLTLCSIALLAAALDAQQPARMRGKAPEFAGREWINTTSGAPVETRGKVAIIHFWTYGCINCRHNLPSYERWQKQFAGKDVVMVGINTPEFEEERVRSNVESRIKEFRIAWPVLLDPRGENWRRWNQQYWPAVYLVDRKGRLRYRWDGELNWGNAGGEARMARLVEDLLQEQD